jgi:hypothetical protein
LEYSVAFFVDEMGSTEDSAFLVSFVTNLLIGLIVIISFLVLRRTTYFYRFYARVNDDKARPHRSLFGWIKPTFLRSEEVIFRDYGLDTLMYIKFLKMCLLIILVQSSYGIIILFPVNTNGEISQGLVSGLARLSIAR